MSEHSNFQVALTIAKNNSHNQDKTSKRYKLKVMLILNFNSVK